MPNQEIAAKRYAEAVFDIAREQQAFDRWRADLQAVAGVFGDPEMLGLLENAKLAVAAKTDLLRRTLTGVSPVAFNFAQLLVRRRRENLAQQIADAFNTMLDEHRGIAHAEVTTAVAVSDEERRLIVERLSQLTGKNVDVQTHVDPRIIGGMIARVGDHLIDGSTRTRLHMLRQRLETGR
jgi:F-type H+-transporting ATPase subunit delta